MLTTPTPRLHSKTGSDWRVGLRADGSRQQRRIEHLPTLQAKRVHVDHMLATGAFQTRAVVKSKISYIVYVRVF